MRSDGKLRDVTKIFLVNRIFLFAVSIVALYTLPLGAGFKITTASLINPWAQWDGEAYLTIAEKGYITLSDGRSLYNFLPLYPFLIRIVGALINNFGLAAFLFSNFFAGIAAYFLFRLTEHEFGAGTAKKAIVLLLFFPTAFFFSAVYTESLFLAIALASFYYARKGNWLAGGLLAMPLPFVRIVGLFFWLVLAIEYFYQNKRNKLSVQGIGLVAALAGVGLFFAFSFYNTGSLFGYANQQNLWTRAISSPHVALVNAFGLFSRGPVLAIYSIWNLAILAFFAATICYAIKHMPKSYSVYMFFAMIFPLLSGTLEGFSRFILICFPSFMIAAKFLEGEKKFYMPLVVVSAFLLIILTARFVTGAVETVFG